MERSGLFQVWKEAFNEEDAYIEFFIKEGVPLGHILSYPPTNANNEAPQALLLLLPITCFQDSIPYPGFYLYALGALRSARGKGYGKALVKEAEKHAFAVGKRFVLLQPTNPSLHKFYSTCGYKHNIIRSFLNCSRASLSVASKEREQLFHLLSQMSALTAPSEAKNLVTYNLHTQPHCTAPMSPAANSSTPFSHFVWSPALLEYIQKECLFRGGTIIEHSATGIAYCYPTEEKNDLYLEIKEFRSSPIQIPVLVSQILSQFPHINRFRFYGIPFAAPVMEQWFYQPPATEPFALLRFLDPNLQQRYNSHQAYFALGLD